MAMAHMKTNHEQYDEAEDFYREIIKNNSGNSAAMNNLGVLLAAQGQNLDESLKLVNRAIELAGPVSTMLDSRASVYLALKRPKKALADMKRSIEVEDDGVRRFHQAP